MTADRLHPGAVTESDANDSIARVAFKFDIVVIGAGQAGLSSAYHLQNLDLAPGKSYLILEVTGTGRRVAASLAVADVEHG